MHAGHVTPPAELQTAAVLLHKDLIDGSEINDIIGQDARLRTARSRERRRHRNYHLRPGSRRCPVFWRFFSYKFAERAPLDGASVPDTAAAHI